MKTALSTVLSGALTLGALAYACPALADDEHKILATGEIKWGRRRRPFQRERRSRFCMAILQRRACSQCA